jgi:DNA repair ATPase RecN
VRQTRDRDSLEKEIERIKGQMGQMMQASAKVDELKDQIYPDGDGSEIAEELRRKECRLKNTVSLAGKYGKLTEEVMPESREE